MVGAIRKRDVFAHPFVTVKSFGWHVFFRAVVAGRNETFLSLLAEIGTIKPSTVCVPKLVDRCVELELQAARVYQQLAGRYTDCKAATKFFESLARQEQGHAELLKVCQVAAGRGSWEEQYFAPWRDAVPRLEQQMNRAAATLESVDDLTVALRLVIQVESSEINSVFKGIVAASDSDFVKRLRAFQTAGSRHIAYISGAIAKLAPQLSEECKRMRVD